MNTVNTSISLIEKYFPSLSDKQKEQFSRLDELYRSWNEKINVISRKDIDNLYEHHVLHSLAIAKMVSFRSGSSVLDLGTGGGFPGIPLAILFPEVDFCLIDSIGKKIRVATEVAEAIGLKNIELKHKNGKEEKGKFDFCVSRAVMDTMELVNIIKKNIKKEQRNSLPNGLICLKGGDLSTETQSVKKKVQCVDISDYFSEDFFLTKKIIYLPLV